MSKLSFKKNTGFNIFKMAAAMTPLPKIMKTAIACLVRKIETCKKCQNVGIDVSNPAIFMELKYHKQLQRYECHRDFQS